MITTLSDMMHKYKQITDFNSHTITSQSKLSVLVYGFGYAIGYSYSAGVNLMQLTGKIEKYVNNN